MKYKYTQIAQEADVSISTVSRVLRGLKGASEETRQKIFATAQAIGHYPAILSPRVEMVLLGRERKTLSLRADPFYALVLEGIEARARTLKIRLALNRLPEDIGPYGVLYMGHGNKNQLNDLAREGQQVTLVDEDDSRFDRVVSQNEEGGEAGANHLLDQVPTDKGIAVIAGRSEHYSFRLRRKGAIAALLAAGRFNPELVFEPSKELERPRETDSEFEQQRLGGRLAARWVRDRLDQIGGVVVHNDLAALSMLEEFARLGVGVPDQVKVVGFDDEIGASDAPIPLSTVRVDHMAMGMWAVDLLLLRILDHKRPIVKIVVGSQFIERASSRRT